MKNEENEYYAWRGRINEMIRTSIVDEDKKVDYDQRLEVARTYEELGILYSELKELQPSPESISNGDVFKHFDKFI